MCDPNSLTVASNLSETSSLHRQVTARAGARADEQTGYVSPVLHTHAGKGEEGAFSPCILFAGIGCI